MKQRTAAPPRQFRQAVMFCGAAVRKRLALAAKKRWGQQRRRERTGSADYHALLEDLASGSQTHLRVSEVVNDPVEDCRGFIGLCSHIAFEYRLLGPVSL